ncbi:MAG: hypothetical protein SPI12_00375 [Actinomycetaceae bacterium]|nr:hypothetical protein [Actinomycetaceae bacterium]MDY6082308.1 hypothetical protein [Actinomycetaceae bacterium]
MTPQSMMDSFLCVDGRVTNVEGHKTRLKTAVEAHFGWRRAAELDDIYARLGSGVGPGCRFPRIRVDAERSTWQDRPAPQRQIRQVVAGVAIRDQRQFPGIKGPDIQWLTDTAHEIGTDYFIVDSEGCVLETNTSAVLLIDDEGEFVTCAGHNLPSTTVQWLQLHVRVRAVPLSFPDVVAAVRAGRAVSANALHGFRMLTFSPTPPPSMRGSGRPEGGAPGSDTLTRVSRLNELWLQEATPLS